MSYNVSVRFRKSKDYSNENKDTIIFTLPGAYCVPREALNDMDGCGWHVFEFDNPAPAENFARSLLGHSGAIFDIKPEFKFQQT